MGFSCRTTPSYSVNPAPHIGQMETPIAADFIKREWAARHTPEAFTARRLAKVDARECDDCRALAEAKGAWPRLSSSLHRFTTLTRLRTLAIRIRR